LSTNKETRKIKDILMEKSLGGDIREAKIETVLEKWMDIMQIRFKRR
jgi:hypothetical protein